MSKDGAHKLPNKNDKFNKIITKNRVFFLKSPNDSNEFVKKIPKIENLDNEDIKEKLEFINNEFKTLNLEKNNTKAFSDICEQYNKHLDLNSEDNFMIHQGYSTVFNDFIGLIDDGLIDLNCFETPSLYDDLTFLIMNHFSITQLKALIQLCEKKGSKLQEKLTNFEEKIKLENLRSNKIKISFMNSLKTASATILIQVIEGDYLSRNDIKLMDINEYAKKKWNESLLDIIDSNSGLSKDYKIYLSAALSARIKFEEVGNDKYFNFDELKQFLKDPRPKKESVWYEIIVQFCKNERTVENIYCLQKLNELIDEIGKKGIQENVKFNLKNLYATYISEEANTPINIEKDPRNKFIESIMKNLDNLDFDKVKEIVLQFKIITLSNLKDPFIRLINNKNVICFFGDNPLEKFVLHGCKDTGYLNIYVSKYPEEVVKKGDSNYSALRLAELKKDNEMTKIFKCSQNKKTNLFKL